MTKKIKHTFTKEEVKQIMKEGKYENPLNALEGLAYYLYDLRHNASLTLGKVTKTSFEVVELP